MDQQKCSKAYANDLHPWPTWLLRVNNQKFGHVTSAPAIATEKHTLKLQLIVCPMANVYAGRLHWRSTPSNSLAKASSAPLPARGKTGDEGKLPIHNKGAAHISVHFISWGRLILACLAQAHCCLQWLGLGILTNTDICPQHRHGDPQACAKADDHEHHKSIPKTMAHLGSQP